VRAPPPVHPALRNARLREPRARKIPWRRLLLIAGIVLLAIVGLTLWSLYRAARYVEPWYQQAIAAQPSQQQAHGQKMERRLLDLRNDVRQPGRFEAVFTDEEINGWLAVDLPRKFPRTLPSEVREPRVAIHPDQVQLAFQVESDSIAVVMHLALDVQLTDQPNVLAVRLHKAKAGMLPLPLDEWLEDIDTAAHGAGIPMRWTQQDGDPVALITIPVQHPEYEAQQIHLDTIELREGTIYLAGRAEEGPRTPRRRY
jgi:hypothetical protein